MSGHKDRVTKKHKSLTEIHRIIHRQEQKKHIKWEKKYKNRPFYSFIENVVPFILFCLFISYIIYNT